MPAIPLPFITATVLILIIFNLHLKKDSALKPVMMFLVVSTIIVILVGLRWSLHILILRQLQAVLASILPLFAWQAFRTLASHSKRRFLQGCLLVATVSGVLVFFPSEDFPVDFFIALVSIGFGGALTLLAWRGPDQFSLCRLSETTDLQKSAWLTGALLCFSGLTDMLVFADFTFYAGHHAAFLVASAQVGVLLSLVVILFRVGKSQPSSRAEYAAIYPDNHGNCVLEKKVEEPQIIDSAEEQRICQFIDKLITEQSLYLDPDLTLERLARKALIPGRKISHAVNRVQQRNVSQLINSYRITEAQRLLNDTELPVTEIMAESGFRTKSNFNREFLRRVGMNPVEYRRMLNQPDDPVSAPES